MSNKIAYPTNNKAITNFVKFNDLLNWKVSKKEKKNISLSQPPLPSELHCLSTLFILAIYEYLSSYLTSLIKMEQFSQRFTWQKYACIKRKFDDSYLIRNYIWERSGMEPIDWNKHLRQFTYITKNGSWNTNKV